MQGNQYDSTGAARAHDPQQHMRLKQLELELKTDQVVKAYQELYGGKHYQLGSQSHSTKVQHGPGQLSHHTTMFNQAQANQHHQN